jgi:hypothetical protein
MKEKRQHGFLLLFFLLVFSLLLSSVVLSLTYTHWLWRASSFELEHSALMNAHQAAFNRVQRLLRQQQIPVPCWHEANTTWLNKEWQKPSACALFIAGAQHYYALEAWSQTNTDTVIRVSYRCLIWSHLGHQSMSSEYFGVFKQQIPPISF